MQPLRNVFPFRSLQFSCYNPNLPNERTICFYAYAYNIQIEHDPTWWMKPKTIFILDNLEKISLTFDLKNLQLPDFWRKFMIAYIQFIQALSAIKFSIMNSEGKEKEKKRKNNDHFSEFYYHKQLTNSLTIWRPLTKWCMCTCTGVAVAIHSHFRQPIQNSIVHFFS